jgi:hypothetical protein
MRKLGKHNHRLGSLGEIPMSHHSKRDFPSGKNTENAAGSIGIIKLFWFLFRNYRFRATRGADFSPGKAAQGFSGEAYFRYAAADKAAENATGRWAAQSSPAFSGFFLVKPVSRHKGGRIFRQARPHKALAVRRT